MTAGKPALGAIPEAANAEQDDAADTMEPAERNLQKAFTTASTQPIMMNGPLTQMRFTLPQRVLRDL